VAGPVAAQYPRARIGEFEVRGFDFTPNGAWRRSSRLVMDARRSMLRTGAVASLNAGTPRTTVRGHYFVPVIPILFRNATAPFAAPQYQDLFFNPAPVGRAWSVRSYYTAASRGNIVLDGNVFPWVPVDSSAAYYEDGCNGIGVLAPCPAQTVSRMGELLRAALDSISRGPGGDTVWNRFDNDGPDGIPNSGDDDGVIDVVAFLQPALDGACGGDGLWSHRGGFSLWNNGQPYVTRTPRRDASGNPIPGQFLTIDSYTIQSAVGGDDACTASQIMPIGTVTHETGHAFGLPDLYDTDPNSATQGAGEWSLMSSGPYARPYSPSSFDAWSLVQLGWVNVDTLASGASRTAAPVQTSGTVYYASTDGPLYLLLENRGNVGTDTAQMNPVFAHAKVPGLLAWLIDDVRVSQGALPVNRVNTGQHQGVALVQADGLDQLRTPFGGNRGDGGDPFPGTTGNHDFGLMTLPAAIDWNAQPLDIRLDQIVAHPDGSVSFRYLRRAPSVISSNDPLAHLLVNGVSTARYTEVVAPGDPLQLSADSTQVSFDGRSAARFVSWSDGGARAHVTVARAGAPDSIAATFAVTNRLRITVSGAGSVTSSVSGAVGTGAFLDAATAVHLVAVPANGSTFVGWRGDTTGTGPLDVTMQHPFDLTAVFAAAVTIDAAAAARALLGGPPLDAASAAYLDAVGNQNGIYDVGDYLAWLSRTGQQIPAALQRVRGS
jgi:M6 family metalloprotease-like protein